MAVNALQQYVRVFPRPLPYSPTSEPGYLPRQAPPKAPIPCTPCTLSVYRWSGHNVTACFALSLTGIKAETERRRFHSTTKRGCENTPGLGFNPRRVFHKHHEDRRGPLTWGIPKCHQDSYSASLYEFASSNTPHTQALPIRRKYTHHQTYLLHTLCVRHSGVTRHSWYKHWYQWIIYPLPWYISQLCAWFWDSWCCPSRLSLWAD